VPSRRTLGWVQLAPARGGPVPSRRTLGWVYLAPARGGPVPSRRTLAAGIHALRSLVGNLASPSWLRSVSQRRLDWHGPTPREPVFCQVLELEKGTGTSLRSEPVPFSLEAPQREPGGRRAVGPSWPPEARAPVHHPHARPASASQTAPGVHRNPPLITLGAPLRQSMKPESSSLRAGACSLRTALASICRIRSRVTLKMWPTSSSV